MPLGPPRHFWRPEMLTSTFQASVSTWQPPRLRTASTTSRASCSRQAAPISASGWTMPVEVLDQAGERRFEAGARRSGDRKRPPVGRTEDAPRKLRDLIHDRGEGRV